MTKREAIDHFLEFMEAHKDNDMYYDGTTGLLITQTCKGMLGSGCCSRQYDLESLYDALKQSDPPTGN